jgi:IS5 family transposase
MGPPRYPVLLMFKALLLQQWYGLSDPGLEEALCDRMSFRRFVGLAADQAAPDHATLWRFRQSLAKGGLDQAAFEAVAGELEARGLIVKQGTLIDASLVASQSRPPSPPEDLEPGASRLVGSDREPDAGWTRRGSRRVFGYKVHIAVDKGSGLVRRVLTTPASVNDTAPADDLLLGDEKEVWADKAYDSHARRARLKALGVKNRICRRANKHHPEPSWSRRRNDAIARIRGRVETVFAILKRHYGKSRARYLTLQRNHTDLILACLAINLRRALVISA